jgi:DNA-binding transcriptional ArsR family regulator
MSPRSAGSTGVARAAPVFAALGDETRLALVARLGAARPLSIAQLTAGTAVTMQAITKHLQVLAHAGLVSDARRGRERLWQLEANRLDEARSYLDSISKRWDDALDRLRRFLED